MDIVKFFKATTDYFKYMSEHPTDYTKQREFINLVENNNAVLEALVQQVWQPNKSLELNDVIWSPNMPVNTVAVVTKAGTTGDTEPSWSGDVTDNTVTYVLKEEVPTQSFSYLDVYPVGAIYISTIGTSPATLFGGEWEQLGDGRVLIGANDDYPAGTIGGEEEVTLTIAELPSHSHGGTIGGGSHNHTASCSSDGAHTHTIGIQWRGGSYAAMEGARRTDEKLTTTSAGAHSHTITVNTSASHSHTFTDGAIGGGGSHSNIQKSYCVYMWKRMA